jgi:hypothetical protein
MIWTLINRLNNLNLIDIPAEHFDLQYRFAQRASELTGKDIVTCLIVCIEGQKPSPLGDML